MNSKQTVMAFNMPLKDKVLDVLSSDRFSQKFGGVAQSLIVPLIALVIFAGIWQVGAKQVVTSLGAFPGPSQVAEQFQALVNEHQAEQDKAESFQARVEKRAEKAKAKGASEEKIAKILSRTYTGPPTFFDQILTSLGTVMTGFILGSIIAIPLGVVIGMNNVLYEAFNPIIQIFKPVSPLAWLPLVTMVVSAVYVSDNPMFEKSFITSAVTVTLCCLWPTIVNTAVGVSGVNKDLINVSRVLQLSWFTKTTKVILPSSVPMIFTGLRLSIGIGWMVLIAAEMLAQNPGLGKFVWDEFQNGSSNSLSRIMVAVLVIGLIGFALDRIMLMLQKSFSWDKNAILR